MTVTVGINAGFVTSQPTADPSGGDTTTVDYRATYIKDTSPVGGCTITEIGWWCNNATEAANYEVAIYTDDSNYPDNVVGSIDATNAKGTGSGWKRADGQNIELNGETGYWIAMQCDNTATTTYADNESSGGSGMCVDVSQTALYDPAPAGSWVGDNYTAAIYGLYEAAAANSQQINIGDAWKDIGAWKLNVGDAWKEVAAMQINIGDVWKEIF